MDLFIENSIIVMVIVIISALFIYQSRKLSKQQEHLSSDIMRVADGLSGRTEEVSRGVPKDKDNALEGKHDTEIDALSFEDILRKYHDQALEQSRMQFLFSLAASMIGLIFIIYTIVTVKDMEWYESLVKAFPGIVIEAVSVLFLHSPRRCGNRQPDS